MTVADPIVPPPTQTSGEDVGGDDEDLYQDTLSQFPILNGYTHIVLGFALAPDASDDAIAAELQTGVDRLIAQIPWLGWQVEDVPDGAGRPSAFRPTPWPSDAPANHVLHVEHRHPSMPPMDHLLLTRAPTRHLPADLLTPWPSLPRPHGIAGPVPIARLQANLIRGGLLLNLSLHHHIVDGTGILQLTRLLALTLRSPSVPLPAADLAQAHRDRRRVIPLLPASSPKKDYRHLLRPPSWRPPSFPSPPQWGSFRIPLSSLARLVRSAHADTAKPSQPASAVAVPRLSANDVLCAFIWQRVVAVRLARGGGGDASAGKVVQFARAIDARAVMGVPASYMGHMVHHAAVRWEMGEVAGAGVGGIAVALRAGLRAGNSAWAVRSMATFMAGRTGAERAGLMYGAPFDPGVDLVATAITAGVGDAREGAEALPDFGAGLGRVRFFRRPDVSRLPGSITFTPVEDGAVPVVLCLPEEDLVGLRGDVVWRRYVQYVG